MEDNDIMEIREEASNSHVDPNGIRRIWNAMEPYILSSYLKYEAFVITAIEDNNPSVEAFLKTREEYFKETRDSTKIVSEKENMKTNSKNTSKINKLRDMLKARLQGDVLDIDDSESEDGWM